MLDAENFKLLLSYNGIFLFIGAIVILFLSFFYYKRTIPPLNKRFRFLLAGIRYTVLFLILALFFEPRLVFNKIITQKPEVVFFIDNSQSIMFSSDSTDVPAKMKNFTEKIFDFDSTRNSVYIFSEKIEPLLKDSLEKMEFNGRVTDFSELFDKLIEIEDSFAAAVIVSDGSVTFGENPLDKINEITLPVYTVGAGTRTDKDNIEIKRVTVNRIVYKDREVPVSVTLFASGEFDPAAEQIAFFADGKLISRKTVEIKSGEVAKVPFDFIPEKTGKIRLTVKAEKLKGERNLLDNIKTLEVESLEKKKKILFVSSSPHYDYAFIKRAVKSDTNFTVEDALFFSDTDEPSTSVFVKAIKSADAIFFIGFPSSNVSEKFRGIIKKELSDGKPYFFEFTNAVDISAAKGIFGSFPRVRTSRPKFSEAQPAISFPEAPFFENIPNAEELSAFLPPVHFISASLGFPSYFRPFINASVGGTLLNTPVALYAETGNARKVYFTGEDFWKWKMQSNENSVKYFDVFFANIAKWLTADSEIKPFRLLLDKRNYAQTEAPEIIAQVYNQFLEPVENAKIEAELIGTNFRRKIMFTSGEQGIYSAQIKNLPPGNYTLRATAFTGGKKHSSEIAFTVLPVNVEKATASLNVSLLSSIAKKTGAEYYELDDEKKLFDELAEKLRKTKKRIKNNFIFFPRQDLLIFIILLLTIEWILRKRKGLL